MSATSTTPATDTTASTAATDMIAPGTTADGTAPPAAVDAVPPSGIAAAGDRDQPVDDARLAAFEERLVGALNDGALCLMLSIGHRTRLLDAMAELGTTSIASLAAHAGLDERYVTEWLGAMTTGRIVDHDPDRGTYALPVEHARLLTRTATENLAVFAQYIPLLAAVEDQIVDCFHHGGGVDYAAFPRFQEVMEEDSAQTVLAALHEHILPLVDGLTDRLERGIHVIDVGCGRGRALAELAARYPNSTFAGYDISEEAVAHARDAAARRGLDNVTYHACDAARLAEVVPAGSAGLVTTFDAVHDQADPEGVVRAIRRVLADDGVYLAQDIDATSTHHGDLDHPIGPLLYTISCMHCMTVSLARSGAGLGAMWGRQRALELFGHAGFGDVEVHTLDHDPQNAYYVCRP
jgi:SAM-dependent methyltransferase